MYSWLFCKSDRWDSTGQGVCVVKYRVVRTGALKKEKKKKKRDDKERDIEAEGFQDSIF